MYVHEPLEIVVVLVIATGTNGVYTYLDCGDILAVEIVILAAGHVELFQDPIFCDEAENDPDIENVLAISHIRRAMLRALKLTEPT